MGEEVGRVRRMSQGGRGMRRIKAGAEERGDTKGTELGRVKWRGEQRERRRGELKRGGGRGTQRGLKGRTKRPGGRGGGGVRS